MDQQSKTTLRDRVAGWFSGGSQVAAKPAAGGSGKVQDPLPPKTVRAGATATPTVFDKAKPDTSQALRETDRNVASLDLTTLRGNYSSTKTLLQQLCATNPELAASVDGYVRTAVTKSVTVKAFNRDQTFNPEATRTLHTWLANINYIGNYEEGFAPMRSVIAVAESLAVELRTFGACSLELVLDKARLPWFLMPVGVRDIKWYPDTSGKWTVPHQVVGGTDINLDVATYFYVSLDQSLYTAYSSLPLESAIQPVQFGLQFINEVRRVVSASIHPRVKVTLNQEELRKLMPPDAAASSEGTMEFINGCIDQVVDRLNGLEPQEALVMLDTMEVDILQRGNTSLDSEYKTLKTMIDGMIASGSKTLPNVLGKGDGSQSTASVQAMLYLISVRGAVQAKLNEILSRVLTLAARLLGLDVTVQLAFEDISLRPEMEMEGFKAQKQSRILDLLSLGFISDEEASIELTGRLPSGTIPTPLSGTMFRSTAGVDPSAQANNYSNTSVGGDGGGGALNENLKSKAPAGKRGDQGNKGNN